MHAGTGGVGLAAVQVSQAMGAQVLATAGSESKRTLLRQMGVTAAVGSRDTEFASVLVPSGAQGMIIICTLCLLASYACC